LMDFRRILRAVAGERMSAAAEEAHMARSTAHDLIVVSVILTAPAACTPDPTPRGAMD
jgi:hypothetical protein